MDTFGNSTRWRIGAMANDVTIPGAGIDTGGNDILDPVVQLLTGINMLGTQDQAGSFLNNPKPNVAIIESTATSLTKVVGTLVGSLGGASAVATGGLAIWGGLQGGERIAVIAASAGLLSAIAVALSVIVGSDIRGRATGAVAIYEARATVTREFLNVAYNASRGTLSAGAPASGTPANVSIPDATAQLSAISDQLSTADQRAAVLSLAATNRVGGALPVTVSTDSGIEGTLQGLFFDAGSVGAAQVQVDILTAAGVHQGVPLGSVTHVALPPAV
jgi:hypothetical protein